MKKIIFIILALVTTTSSFALPPPKSGGPPPHSKPINVERRVYRPSNSYHIDGPTTGMRNAVLISGIIATGLRMVEEMANPPSTQPVIIQEDTNNTIIIKEMNPVVERPVPISIVPLQIISYP